MRAVEGDLQSDLPDEPCKYRGNNNTVFKEKNKEDDRAEEKKIQSERVRLSF